MSPVELGQQVNLHKLIPASLGVFNCYRNVENFFSISVQKSRVLVISNSLQILDLAPNSVQSSNATCVEIYELESLQKMNLRKESKSLTLLFQNGKSVTYVNMEHLHQCAECIKKAMERIGMEGTIVSKSPSSTPQKDSKSNNNNTTQQQHDDDVGSYVTLARQLEFEFSAHPSMELIQAIMDLLRQAVEKSSELNTYTPSPSKSSSSSTSSRKRLQQQDSPHNGNGSNTNTTTSAVDNDADGAAPGQYQETVELIQKFLKRADVATLLDSMIPHNKNNNGSSHPRQSTQQTPDSSNNNSSKKSESIDDGDDRISSKSNLESLINGMTSITLQSNKITSTLSTVPIVNNDTITHTTTTAYNMNADESGCFTSWDYYNATELESIENLEYSFNDDDDDNVQKNGHNNSGGRDINSSNIDISDEFQRDLDNITDEFDHLTQSFQQTNQSTEPISQQKP